MNVSVRHLTADLYGCKADKVTDKDAISQTICEKIVAYGHKILNTAVEEISENHCAVTVIFDEGHAILEIYGGLRYIAADIFLCREDAQPEPIFNEVRNFLKPEKTRITVLKRGDFKQGQDMKPKTKTRMAPLRKIHNTGAKVIRSLARRKET